METELIQDFTKLLKRANYFPLSADSLERAFAEKSLIELKTSVNFNDFQQMVCYSRGDIYKNVYDNKLFKQLSNFKKSLYF